MPAVPPTVGTAAIIAITRHIYDDKMDNFNKANLIKRTIFKQINTALDNDVLANLIDGYTCLLVVTITEIMMELYNTYSTVTPQSLTFVKEKLEVSMYDHSRPLAKLFTEINHYSNMAEASGATETP